MDFCWRGFWLVDKNLDKDMYFCLVHRNFGMKIWKTYGSDYSMQCVVSSVFSKIPQILNNLQRKEANRLVLVIFNCVRTGHLKRDIAERILFLLKMVRY